MFATQSKVQRGCASKRMPPMMCLFTCTHLVHHRREVIESRVVAAATGWNPRNCWMLEENGTEAGKLSTAEEESDCQTGILVFECGRA